MKSKIYKYKYNDTIEHIVETKFYKSVMTINDNYGVISFKVIEKQY